jgi:FkbM family methyltransferase
VSIEQRWQAFWELYRADGWEPDTQALVRDTLRPGDLFVDIGAWIGPVTLWALDCGADVIAIEPDPMALAELRRRVPAEVEIWEGAVGLASGTARLACCSEYGDSMSRVCDEGIEVQCWPLAEILGDRRPALATMDVEGYELTLLPQVAPYLASLGSTLMVALHTDLPDPAWFKDFGQVQIPPTVRNRRGRSLSVVARP